MKLLTLFNCYLVKDKQIFLFLFFCFSVGHETEHWSVYRRYLEFYVLESKLTEFHGTVQSDLHVVGEIYFYACTC